MGFDNAVVDQSLRSLMQNVFSEYNRWQDRQESKASYSLAAMVQM